MVLPAEGSVDDALRGRDHEAVTIGMRSEIQTDNSARDAEVPGFRVK